MGNHHWAIDKSFSVLSVCSSQAPRQEVDVAVAARARRHCHINLLARSRQHYSKVQKPGAMSQAECLPLAHRCREGACEATCQSPWEIIPAPKHEIPRIFVGQ